MTVLENLMLAPTKQAGEQIWNPWFLPWRVSREEEVIFIKAMQVLEFVDLIHLRDEYASNLSGGQKKLLELARTLMSNPKMVLTNGMRDRAGSRIRPPEKKTIGNFWVDVTRATVYVLLPISIVGALFFVSQGVVQNLNPYTTVTTVEGAKQTIAQGPVASQEAIKQLGTNGGGFFNANSSHPFENPTPFSNLLQMFLIFVIPAALTYTFGRMVGDTRQGWAILRGVCRSCS